MKEVRFIDDNRDKWKAYERTLLREDGVKPSELDELYTELTDDVSFVKTVYPESKIVPYLENLAVKAHRRVYSNSKERKGRIKHFLLREVPLEYYKSRREMLMSFLIFMAAIGIGVFSCIQDPEYVRTIMGDSYVNMTLDNIEKGDPLAVYDQMNENDMFTYIALNNVRVSFAAFVAGIVGSFGTIFILFKNGVMVGAFLSFFVQKGLGVIGLTTIFIHGALELSAIVLAGAAGLVMGNSLLFPGTYKRTVSLVRGARRAVKLIIGLVPVFIVAAFIEGYVTRHYIELGLYGRLIIIALSFAYIIWYFILLPQKLSSYAEQKIY